MKTEKKDTYNSDITEDDLNVLGDKVQNTRNSQQGDDSQLAKRINPVDFTGNNLDIPSSMERNKDTTRLDDEENKLHSLGSGHNDHLEDNQNHSPKA